MRKGLLIAIVGIGLFFPAHICLAGEPGTVIQLSMGMVIIGGAVLLGGSSLGLKKTLKKRRPRLNNTAKQKKIEILRDSMDWAKVKNGDMFGSFGSGKFSRCTCLLQRIVCYRQGIFIPKGKYPAHVGVIQKRGRRKGNKITFIEALIGQGMTVSPFEKYAESDVEIYRFNHEAFCMPEKQQRQLFVNRMLEFEGTEYDFLGIGGVVFYALGYTVGLALNDQKRLFCSEGLGQAALQAFFPPFFMRDRIPVGMLCPIHISVSKITHVVI